MGAGNADEVGCAAAQALGQYVAIQREVLCRVGIAGTDPRPDMAGQGHKCVKSALAKKECRQEKRFAEWASLGIKFLKEIRNCSFVRLCKQRPK